jgi:hypothetical protein
MTRVERRRTMKRLEKELELRRPVSLAQMPAPTTKVEHPLQQLTTRPARTRHRLPLLLQRARLMTMF